MQKRIAACFGILAAAAALAGCGTRYERSISSRPGGGIVRIIAKPSQIVFPAALRVMHDTGEEIWEADQKAGRIVSISALGKRAVFFTPLSHGRTRVEISSDLPSSLFRGDIVGPGNFFILLREQIVAYEKKAAFRKSELKKRKVDANLRTKFKQKLTPEEERPPAAEPAPPPAPPGRFQRFRRRYN